MSKQAAWARRRVRGSRIEVSRGEERDRLAHQARQDENIA